MAQTTLNIYTGDQIYKLAGFFAHARTVNASIDCYFHSYVIRLLGTFVGLIIGLLIWYIGALTSVATLPGWLVGSTHMTDS